MYKYFFLFVIFTYALNFVSTKYPWGYDWYTDATYCILLAFSTISFLVGVAKIAEEF